MGGRKLKRNRANNAKEHAKVSWILTLFGAFVIGILYLIKTYRYSFVDGILFPLWYVALGLGVIVGVALDVALIKKVGNIKLRIAVFLIFTFVAFMVFGFALGHINHIFDSSETVRYYVEIEDKDIDLNRRAPDTYDFEVTVNGDTFDIQVPLSDYYSHDVGDSYVIEYHEGALGEPYYIAVGPVP